MSQKKLKDQCDELIVKYHRIKYGSVCQICDVSFSGVEYLMPCHLLSKGAYPNLRYEFYNILWCCDKCHKKLDIDKMDEVTVDKLIELRGPNFKIVLMRKSREIGKLFMPDVKNMLRYSIKNLGDF